MLTTCVASAGITVIYNDLPTLQRVFPGQPALAWVVTVYWLFSAVAAAVCGRYGDAIGRRRMMCIVLLLCSSGALVSANAHSLWIVIAGRAVQSVASAITPLAFRLFRENLAGYSITACGLYNLIIESTPTQRTSEAMGFTYVLFTAFFAVGAQIIFALLRTSRIVEPLHGIADFPSQAAFSLSFGYIALTGLVGVGVALGLPDRQPLKLLEAAAL